MAGQMTATELNKMRVQTLPDERTPEERRKARKKLAKAKRKRLQQEVVTSKTSVSRDRKFAVATVIVIGMVMVGIIFVSAYCASIKYDINTMNKEIVALQEDIDFLKVEIESGTNIATIEKKALKELGMIYPTAEQFVYIDLKKPVKEDLAQVIKENAYEF